jgi:putative oxidoreductase
MSLSRLNSKLIAFGNCLQSPLLLIIRLFWGGTFVATGIGKLTHIEGIITYFQMLKIPFPAFNAYLTGSIELIGGAFLLLGLFSRWAAIPLILMMLVAFTTAEMEATRMIFNDPQNFIHRTPFSFLFASLLIFVFGPGKASLDYWFWKNR